MEYVINMLACPEQVTVSQISEKNIKKAMELYIKNSIVCFSSINKHNPQVKLMLCTNYEIPDNYKKIFNDIGISIHMVSFDVDVTSKSNWSICNYRYCVMKYLVETLRADDIVLMLDTDVICVGNLNELFKDVFDDILLYDINHARDLKDRKNILDNYKKLYNEDSNLIHYGGEFICSKVKNLKLLYENCIRVIDDSNKINDLVNFNDEHITSMAIYRGLKEKAHNSESYIYRYWTKEFYLAATNWKFNPVKLWHCPVEKQDGFIKIYKYFIKKKQFPTVNKMAKIFGLPNARRPNILLMYLKKFFRKIKLIKQ